MDRSSFDESQNGKPVAGARLSLYDAKGKRTAVKTTTRAGAYRFTKVTPGTYTLAVERKDYLPSPLYRIVTIDPEDTLPRDFLLDRLPTQGGVPVQTLGKKKKVPLPYYPHLAQGILLTGRKGNFFHEATENQITLSRFFDPEDTTEAYRKLWIALTWADIESQKRPLESMVYLAHALDSALKEANSPVPPGVKALLKVPADSIEALSRTVRSLIFSPSKKNPPEALAKTKVPRAMLLEIVQEEMDSKAVPKIKKKNFLLKAHGVLGADVAKAMLAKIDPKRESHKPKKKADAKEEPQGPPLPDTQALWNVVQELSDGKHGNPVALFHVALRNLELGRAREALSDLKRFDAMRADYPQALRAEALCHMALNDTTAAEAMYDSLSKVEAPDWQAKGFQGLAQIQWRKGEGEKAEATLWRALGLDSRSAAARQSLLLLAEVSLTRESWTSVETLLDSLVRVRPREADGHYWLGKMALKRQQDGVALDHFQKASAIAPQRVEFSVATASAYFAREECDPVLKTLRPVRARLNSEGLSIYGQCLLIKGKPKEAVEEFSRLYGSHPSAPNLVQLTRALSASGQARKAVSIAGSSAFTQDFDVRKALAAAKLSLDSADQALQILHSMLAQKETDAELHYLVGQCAFKKRDYAEANKELTSALQYREDYPEAKYQQGLCLLKMGRSGEAHHYFQELMDSEKPSWRAKGLLGQGQAFAKENKLEAAEDNLQKAFNAAGAASASIGAEIAANLAATYMRMAQTDAASSWAEKARKLDPDEPLGLMVFVDVLLAEHRESEAVALAKTGLDKHPGDCEFIIVDAKANLRSGKDADAKALSNQAKNLCPEESAPYFFLGTLAARSGTTAEAKREFGDYLRNGGDAKHVPESYR